MARPVSHTRLSLIKAAMEQFWRHGFAVSSMQRLVVATGVSRHGIYSEFGGKHALFVACLSFYRDEIVTPAFAGVERTGAGLEAIGRYFEAQIALAENVGMPGGPGCFMANTSTELGPRDAVVQNQVAAHYQRLQNGFQAALSNEAQANGCDIASDELQAIAGLLNSFARGLWSMSRTVSDADELRRLTLTQLSLLRSKLRDEQ